MTVFKGRGRTPQSGSAMGSPRWKVRVKPPLIFDRVTSADSAAFYELRRTAILAGCASHYPPETLLAWTDPTEDGRLRESASEHFYFAKAGGEIVGSGMLDVDAGWLDAILVAPRFFGRGLGRAIVWYLERIARSHGLRALALDSSLNAVAFYRSLGFVGDAVGIYESPRPVSLECVPMTKVLDGILQGVEAPE